MHGYIAQRLYGLRPGPFVPAAGDAAAALPGLRQSPESPPTVDTSPRVSVFRIEDHAPLRVEWNGGGGSKE